MIQVPKEVFMYTDETNVEGLKTLYRKMFVARPILSHFKTCSPNETVATVDDLVHTFQSRRYSRQDVVKFFRELEKLGYGDFKIGRKSQKTRFESKVSLTSLGKAAVDGGEVEGFDQVSEKPQQVIEQSLETIQELKNENFLEAKEALSVNQGEVEKIPYYFPLRSNFKAELKLPSDLTHTEAERISMFVKALAIK